MMTSRPPLDSISTRAAHFMADPSDYFAGSHTRAYTVPRDELEALQLECLRQRYTQLRETIPFLRRLSEQTGIETIEALDDVVPLLFDHSVYKGYPPFLLEKGRFDLLTAWLDSLTACDLSKIDASECTSIDEWIALLDRETELRTAHSSGTSGTMSFLPFTQSQRDLRVCCQILTFAHSLGSEDDWREDDPTHVIWPYFARGNWGGQRNLPSLKKFMAGDRDDHMHTLLKGAVSSDVLYFAARLRAATARGQVHSLVIPPETLARKDEYERTLADLPNQTIRFIDEEAPALRGQRVFVIGTWKMAYDMARAGLDRGFRKMFAPDSIVLLAGGTKGWTPAPNWKDDVREYFGVAELENYYGMGEVSSNARLCSESRYHSSPWAVPFVLDPDSGEPLARWGVVTGRVAFYDLLANEHWGGFITGDEVTIDWDGPCACGRTTPSFGEDIQRYSEKRGGDDKITCVATPELHREALDFLSLGEGDLNG